MISFIMSQFGYVRIPPELIQLSIMQESSLENFQIVFDGKDLISTHLKKMIQAQKTMTNFLRLGRLISYKHTETENE